MRILIIGYGSMGRRRIRLLKSLIENIEIVVVDSNEDRMRQAKTDGFQVYQDLEEALEIKYDCAFVCTSPGYHAELILRIMRNKLHIFTEINLIDDKYDEIIKCAHENEIKVFMSSTLLYNKQIQAIQDAISKSKRPLNYIYHVGQYLPDWHPWESYKNYFVASKKTNGCREILAIQLPWIIKVFGEIESCSSLKRKSTALDIEYDDTYYLQIKHKNNGLGTFVCDVASRQATTYLEIFNEDVHIKWDGTLEGLCYFDKTDGLMKKLESYSSVEHIDGYAANIIEDEYKDEIMAFLLWLQEDKKPLYTLENDKYTISIINKIEGDL